MTEYDYIRMMQWDKLNAGNYTANINAVCYRVERNPITKEWHLYVNGEWSTEVDSLKHGKLLAIAKAFNV